MRAFYSDRRGWIMLAATSLVAVGIPTYVVVVWLGLVVVTPVLDVVTPGRRATTGQQSSR